MIGSREVMIKMWVEPLQFETFFVNIFAGDAAIFGAISLIVITAMAAYFRMNALGMFFMIGIFLLMFAGYVPLSITILAAIIGGLLIGYWSRKLWA